jgi:HopA1 effector protein family
VIRRADALGLFGRIASEVWLTSPDAFVHVPTTSPTLDATTERVDRSVASSPPRLPDGLSHFVYAHYYLADPNEVENGRTNALSKIPIRAREDIALGLALRAANRGDGYAEPGWTIVGHDRGGTLAKRGGVTLFLSADDIAGPPIPQHVGDLVAVRFPNDRPYAYPGFYTAVGSGGPTTPESGRPVVRVYFDVSPQHAPALVSALTGTLGASLSRFSLKLLNNPRWYTRPDTAVAYILRDEYPQAWPVVRDVVRSLGDRLGDRVPALACPIARGVAAAEEPIIDVAGPSRPSFGFHRCDLIASGLARAYAAGVESAAGRRAWILHEYEAAGLDPARPWLNPGSEDFIPLDTDHDPATDPTDASRDASSLGVQRRT